MRTPSPLWVVFAGLPTCIAQQGQPDPNVGAHNDYAGAALFAASSVAASGVRRQVLGGCYAQCSPGYGCDEASGLCKPIDCGCKRNEQCVQRYGRYTCSPRPSSASGDAGAGGAPE